MRYKMIGWVISFLMIAPAQAQPTFIKDSLDAYIRKGMQNWDIPGLAIAIVKDGQPVVLKGFGVKNLDTNEPVDENTLFMIASNTKLFTGTALAQLEYNGRLSLNDKITHYFPGFRLYDSSSTTLLTVRDMLSHRIGTKTFQGDFTFWNSTYSRPEIMEKMRLLQPVGPFRQDYGYCNSCFLTAGEIIPTLTGKPWEVYVYDSLVAPLQMRHTQVLSGGTSAHTNIATPYTTLFTGTLHKLPYDVVDNLAPAGSMVSCVSDMAHWLQMQLDTGRYNNRQIVAKQAILKTRDINTIIRSRASTVYPTHFSGYGLGVFAADYNGRQIYYHTGGAFGFVTNTCFVPEEKLGITILTNNDAQSFFELLRYQILDAYLGVPYQNRQATALRSYTNEKEKSLRLMDTLQRLKTLNEKPALAIAAYAGNYNNSLYGNIMVEPLSANSLSVQFSHHSKLSATLTHLGNNDWELRYDPVSYGIFRTHFEIKNGKVKSLLLKVTDFVEYDPYLFTKME